MSQMGGGMSFYGELPDSFNLVVNPNHQLVIKFSEDLQKETGDKLAENNDEAKKTEGRDRLSWRRNIRKKKADEISQLEKDDLEKLRKELSDVENARKDILECLWFSQ